MQKIIGEKITFQSLLLFVSLCSPEILKAQKQTTFYLMPHVGIELPISKFEDKNSIPPIIKGISMTTSAKYGISLLIDFNETWNLNIGYGIGSIGEGFKYEYGDSIVHHQGSFNGSTSIRRGYISLSKPIKLIEIRKKNIPI